MMCHVNHLRKVILHKMYMRVSRKKVYISKNLHNKDFSIFRSIWGPLFGETNISFPKLWFVSAHQLSYFEVK